MSPLKDNPFATILLPLAFVDDLLMHGLLAFSGAHLSFKEPNSTEIAKATSLHYGKLLEGLRVEVACLREDDLAKKERLLRILMIACHYEVLSGNTRGAIFSHLHASRSLIQSLLAGGSGYHSRSPLNGQALGFSIELYAYLVFNNSVTPCGAVKGRPLPQDDCILSPEVTGLFSASGSFLAGRNGIYSLVTEVSLLASRRLDEELAGVTQPSVVVTKTHDDILSRIKSWKMSSPYSKTDTQMLQQTQCVGEAFREGLFIYLATALAGTTVSDPAVILSIQDHVNTLFSYGPQLLSSDFVAAILWPFDIAGTCNVKQDQQETFISVIRSKRFSM